LILILIGQSSLSIPFPFSRGNQNEIVGGFGGKLSHHAMSPPTSTQHVSFSRYKLDFEELAFLGRGTCQYFINYLLSFLIHTYIIILGGFGEVVKAKNKLDGRYVKSTQSFLI
jgi:hypothetical protein